MFRMRIWTQFSIGRMMSEQIEIQVYLHTTLVRFSPDGKTRKFNLYLPEDSTIRDLVEQLGITDPSDNLLFGINGSVADESAGLQSGDRVHVMMPISGG